MMKHYSIRVIDSNKGDYFEHRLPRMVRARDAHDVKCVLQNCMTEANVRHNDFHKAEYIIKVSGYPYNGNCKVKAIEKDINEREYKDVKNERLWNRPSKPITPTNECDDKPEMSSYTYNSKTR